VIWSDAVRPGRSVTAEVVALEGERRTRKSDELATEEPLELRLSDGSSTRRLAVTMRTPGNDFELAAGFLYNEAIVRGAGDFTEIAYCLDPALDPAQRYNVVTIECPAATAAAADPARLERHFTIGSACGVCGRAQLDSLRELGVSPIDDALRVPSSLLYRLPERMQAAQRTFASTGGLHAAALFDERGETLAVREDVGRHNAIDKVVGWGVINARLPFARSIMMVSGRASYEVLQKSVMARIPIVCSVSAPSSLAVDVAREFNVTLVGFLRGNRANVYAGAGRVAS
jgi:FdhD protein